MLAAAGARRSGRGRATRLIVAPGRAARGGRRRRSPATSPRPPSSSSAALLVPGSEVELARGRHQPDPDRAARASSRGWASRWRALTSEGRAMTVHEIREPGPEPIATLQRADAPLAAPTVTRRGCPAGDRRAAAGRPARPASPRARRWSRRRGAARARSRTGSRPSSRASPALGRRDRGAPPTASRSAGRRPARRQRSTRTATTASRCSARSPASPPREGVEVAGIRGRRGQLPAASSGTSSRRLTSPSTAQLARQAAAASGFCAWEGCPSPGQGESTSRSRESSTAWTSWRSFGSKIASSPGPPAARLAVRRVELDVPVDHQQPGALVHLVLLELLALRAG